jgi:hypothetical protein
MIKIEDIIQDNQGFVLIKPKFGIGDNMAKESIAKSVKIKEIFICFSEHINQNKTHARIISTTCA